VAWKNRLEALPAKVSRDPDKNVTRERALSTVNRDMVALRAALNRAYERGLTQSDAAWRLELKPTPNVDGRREAYLKSADRRRLVENADKEIRPFLTLLTLLPLRPGAAAALTVAGYDPKGVLKIPEEKGHRARTIAVPKSTAAFLSKCVKDKLPTAPLVGRSDGRAWGKDSWKGPIKEAVTRAKLPENVTAYTLRHSTITDMTNAGTPALLVAELSGTSVQIIQKHYFKRDDERDRRALAHLKL
jgi:integrase